MKKPDFFIVGSPKCGTSSMKYYLNQHPEVFVAAGEPHYFGSDIEYHEKPLTRDEYRSYFESVQDEKAVGERSTWYLFSEKAAQEIHDFNPEAKIIIQIRNPIDVVHSLHHHLVHHTNRENIEELDKAIQVEEARKEGHKIPESARFPEHLFYTEIPKFSRQINRYAETFGWEGLRIIVFDDFVDNTLTEYQNLLEFLGVQSDFTPDTEVKNRSKTTRSRLLENLKESDTVQHISDTIIPEKIGDLMFELYKKMNKTEHKKTLDRSVKEQLQSEFHREINRLSELLNRDLSHWLE